MSPLASRRVVSAFGLLVPLLLFECDHATRSTDPLAPNAPSIPDSLRRIVLTLHVDLSSHEITYLANTAGAATSSDAPSFSIIGSDGVQLLTSNMNTTLDRKTSLVRFDVAIQNALSSVDLVTPTFPAPPSGATGVLLFPIQETVTSGSGSIRPSADWTGSPFDFFNDDACKKSNHDCVPYATFPNIAAGATSPSQTVGFVVDNGVTDFDVTMLVSAKLVDRPTGSIGGTVTSPQRGPLGGVTVTLDGSGTTATSDANGHYAFNGVTPGSHTVDLTSLASPCTDPGAQTANVTGAATVVVDFSVQCPDPPGTVNGTVRTTDPTPLAGIHVTITPGNLTTTTDAQGNYSFSDVPVGAYALTLVDPPAACYEQNPAALTVKPTNSATINFTLSCPAPVITIDAESEVAFNSTVTLDASQSHSPAGAPLTVHWDAVSGAIASLDGAVASYTTSEMPGFVMWRMTLSDGLHTLTSTVQQFVMQRPGHGVFVSTGGADGDPGTRAAPLATIGAGIAKAEAAVADVYVAAGNYSQSAPLVLSNGTSIYGGLSAAWSFNGEHAAIIGAAPALTSTSGGASNITLEWLNVSSSATVHGSSAVGLYLQNSAGVVLKNDDFTAGVGAAGVQGAAGIAGAVASNGGPGAARSDGGAGGIGGAAALGGTPPTDAAGLGGGDGICSGTLTTRGTNGAAGLRGAAGSRAAAAGPPVYSATGYQPSTGAAGGDGAYGTGGAGGTGGTGLAFFAGCGPGGPGGGGGGGGGAGHGGHGAGSGGGGGASFGLYLSNSSVTASSVSISATAGGIGGGAGVPGAGGAGGTGGLGGSQGDAAQGGNGGRGGPGGVGGAGCGGNGGDIVGVVLFGSSTYADQGTLFTLGSPGGPGGSLCGETSGMKAQIYHPTT